MRSPVRGSLLFDSITICNSLDTHVSLLRTNLPSHFSPSITRVPSDFPPVSKGRGAFDGGPGAVIVCVGEKIPGSEHGGFCGFNPPSSPHTGPSNALLDRTVRELVSMGKSAEPVSLGGTGLPPVLPRLRGIAER